MCDKLWNQTMGYKTLFYIKTPMKLCFRAKTASAPIACPASLLPVSEEIRWCGGLSSISNSRWEAGLTSAQWSEESHRTAVVCCWKQSWHAVHHTWLTNTDVFVRTIQDRSVLVAILNCEKGWHCVNQWHCDWLSSGSARAVDLWIPAQSPQPQTDTHIYTYTYTYTYNVYGRNRLATKVG